MQPIEMICIHEEEGNIRPYRFKMRDDDQEEVVIQIKNVVDKKDDGTRMEQYKVYFCSAIINGYKRVFEIKFRKDACQWWLVGVK